ncbi:molybdenum cofactor guanylyltransferase [Hamadaea tsunoensis]|uniref:molybdenum cofactor guanylyltransferase n=1 Tax=Hamadaea tsunoensis TaxID=53368 RepID=UPI000402760B|nr:NTP transferase domain-containing protein [Hamadaea tsunoensis]
MAYAAVILAGGAARRLGGAPKPLLTVADEALLSRVLAALAAADARVVVGPASLAADLPQEVLLTCEDPPGGGPVAGLAAGLAMLPPDVTQIAVAAADLPFVTAATFADLAADLAGHDVALAVDPSGRRQHLLGVWRADYLRALLPAGGDHAGKALKHLLKDARVAEVRLPDDALPAWLDCDTPEELAHARAIARPHH